VIGDNVVIGSDTTLHGNVTVYEDCELGRRVIIHSGTVIGADGFGFVPDEQGKQIKILQTGNVVIEDDVEVGANCCIDRATFGSTVLRRGVKLDNLIQVAHNCALGEDTVVAAQVGLSGSTTVGRHVVIAGQAATNQHVTINDNVIVGGQAGVTKSVAAGKFVAGTPAQEHNHWKRAQVLVSKLPELFERVKQLEKELEKSKEQSQ
jgi:UDP-3-O-[3-hydroxymyristoyl] glucosamine N-acyltransferase